MTVVNRVTEPIRIELPTPFSIGGVNCYLFKSPEPVLIDCGMNTADSRAALIKGLKDEGLAIKDIKKVIVTHAHVDHAGATPWIIENSDADVWASNLMYDWVVKFDEMWASRIDFVEQILRLSSLPDGHRENYLDYMRQVPSLWGEVSAERTKRFPIYGTLSFGGAEWQTIYAPGHAYTQTCFYEPDSEKLLAADMILPIIPVPVIEQFGLNNRGERSKGLSHYLTSMERFTNLNISTIYPGHGAPFGEHRAVLQQQRRRIDMRTNECFGLVKSGSHTVYALSQTMYARYSAVTPVTGMSMVIGYLDLLLSRNQVVREMRDGRWHFTAV